MSRHPSDVVPPTARAEDVNSGSYARGEEPDDTVAGVNDVRRSWLGQAVAGPMGKAPQRLETVKSGDGIGAPSEASNRRARYPADRRTVFDEPVLPSRPNAA